MRDVLMIVLMITAIVVFAAYVTWCDRIVGRAEPVRSLGAADASDRAEPSEVAR